MSKKSAIKNENVCIGVITSVNGVKGYVKIRSFTEKPTDIVNFNSVFDENAEKKFDISIIYSKKDYVIASISGVKSRNEAELLRNTKLFIKRAELPAASNDEFYHADLLGLEAKYQDGTPAGVVKNVVNFGAGDILEIYDFGTERALYFPFTKQFVPEINLAEQFVVLQPMDEFIAAND